MDKSFHMGNRARFYDMMVPGSLLVLFAGVDVRKTNDEYWPFYADRSFLYMTGIAQKESVLVAVKANGAVQERLYLLPSDAHAERWTGRRLTAAEAEALSGISDIRPVGQLEADLHTLLAGGHYSQATADLGTIYLDLYRCSVHDIDRPAHALLRVVQSDYAFLKVESANDLLRRLRLIKQPCEIEAVRKAEAITGEAIQAMMRASRPGMYEYQYKAEFDYVLSQYGPEQHGFPPIISAGKNNFCIHYYSYTGRAEDGDMILNDVGAQWDDHTTDVSRGFPCNGRFSEKQKLLYECALATSDHMFSIVKPGLPMPFIDQEIRRFNAERLVEAGALKSVEDVGTLMWHGGAHHIGYDVHDVIKTPETIAPGMMFCIDVGIYHEEWGIGFRLEDNCLVTEDGCECLSGGIPRTIHDIEAVMARR